MTSDATPDQTPDETPDETPEALPDGLALPPVPDTDPALASAVLEIESHAARDGWDQPARLYALVETALLVSAQPELAAGMGLDAASAAGSLTAVEQDPLPADQDLEQVLPAIVWPAGVVGCAALVERLVLPPEADPDLPADREEALAFAQSHPHRQEVRIVAGVTRGGATYCALRLRGHDDDASVVGSHDLVPELLELLLDTLEEPHPDGQPDSHPDGQPDTQPDFQTEDHP